MIANDNTNKNNATLIGENIYYTSLLLSDSINQRTPQRQNTQNISGNITFTESTGKQSLLKVDYNINYTPSVSAKNTYDYSAINNNWTLPDTLLSNSFVSKNIAQKAGASYLFHTNVYEFSFGLNFEVTTLQSQNVLPDAFYIKHIYTNVLPVVNFQYKFSKTENLNLTYSTATQAPSVYQLQNVVNNADPLHLTTGNPQLLQPYQHNFTMRYNTSNKNAKGNVE